MATSICVLLLTGLGRSDSPATGPSGEAALDPGLIEAVKNNHDKLIVGAGGYNGRAIVVRYGEEPYCRAAIQDAMRRKGKAYEQVLADFLSSVPLEWRYDCIRETAITSLDSEYPKIREAAVQWCISNVAKLPDNVVPRVRADLRLAFIRSPERILWLVMRYGDKTDIPVIREVYEKHYKDKDEWTPGGMRSRHGCLSFTVGSEMLELLATLGDPKAFAEIKQAILQNEDAQRRTWGIWLAARLKSQELLHSVSQALDDERLCAEPIHHQAVTKVRGAWRKDFCRVCDVAVRAIQSISPPKKPWGFGVPDVGSGWIPYDYAPGYFAYAKQIEVVQGSDAGGSTVTGAFVVGFSKEQITQVTGHLNAMGLARLAEMKAGRGPVLSSIGVENARFAVPDLLVEYVRVKTAIQLTYAPAYTDVPALGEFITGSKGIRELMLLGDKPSNRALEAHGTKWTELNPAEYLIAGRAVGIVVNAANGTDWLTMEQIKGIFAGGIADWGALPAARAEADAASRPTAGKAGDSTKLTASKINCYALKDAEPAAGLFARECLPSAKLGRVTLKKDSNDVIAAVGMDPQAIGFVDLTAAGPANSAVASGAGSSVKVLAIQVGFSKTTDGTSVPRPIRPTEENIRNAMYPLSQRLYLYVHPKASDVAKDFAKFLATCGASEATPYADTVKSVMEAYAKHGLISLADAAIERRAKDAAAAARAAAAKAEREKAAGGKATKKPAR